MKLIRKGILTAMALSAGLSAWADYSNTVMSFNPVGYWRMSETTPVPLPDVATNRGTLGQTATGYYLGGATHPGGMGALVGDPTSTGANFPNPGGSGGTALVRIPWTAALNASSAFSAEFWANPSQTSAIGCPMASVDFNITPRYGWLFYQGDTSLSTGNGWFFRLYSVGTLNAVAAVNMTLEGTAYYHVVGTYDGVNTIKLYVNGAPVATNTLASAYTPNTNGTFVPFTIGARGDGAAGYYGFGGNMDEVAYYTNVLSDADVLAHYQNGINPNPATPYHTLVLASHPAGYWGLDETYYAPPDPTTLPVTANSGTLGALANGTEYPGVTPGVAGPPYSGLGAGNLAFQFDGVDGWVDLGNPDGLNFSGQITMMAWIKPTATDGLRNIVSHGYQTSPDNAEVGLRINAGHYEVWSWGVGNSPGVYNIPIPPEDIGNWVFLAGTYDGATWHLYRDSVEVGSFTDPTGAIVVSDTDWAIGARGTGTERFFGGGIDEVAIFNTGLTAAQIQQIFNAANVPPIFVQQPQAPAGTVYEGSTVTLSPLVAGSPTLAFQWTKNTTNLTGRISSSLTLSNVLTNDSGSYALVVTNAYGAVTSSVVVLSVESGPPLILQQPQPVTRYAGGSAATFSVTVGGSVPYSYQWMLNTTNVINGATGSSYTINPVVPGAAGAYSCIITNPYGSTNTVTAALTVLPIPSGYASVVLADNPIAYWRLGETNGSQAGDYWGGHDGIYHNATLGEPGFSLLDPDTAATFGPGINSYVGSIQGVSFTNAVSSTTFSLEFWANGLPNDQLGDGAFICKGTGGGGEQFCIDGYQSTYRFYGSGAGAAHSTISPDGTWQHVVGVCDGPNGLWVLYVNGQQAASGTIPTTMLNTTHEVTLAGRQSASADYDFGWNALLDEVAVYSKALTADQVLAHYNARYGANTPPLIRQAPAPVTNYVGLVATFTVVAEGSGTLSYQWQKGGTDLPGETYQSLTNAPLDLATSPGTYSVRVSNGLGTTNVSTTLTVLPAPTALNLVQDLVLHLKFDGNYLDSSGRTNNATPHGNPTFVPGLIGANAVSVQVDANDHIFDYVTVANTPDLQFGTNDSFSVSFWVNYTSWPNDDPMIGNAVNSTYQLGWVVCDSGSGTIEVSLASTANSGTYLQDPLPGSPTTDDGAWHNVVLILDRGSQQASTYVDGLLAGKWAIGGLGTMYYNNAITIGNDPTGTYGAGGAGAGGAVDDVGVWRRALTPLEAAAIYVAGISNQASFTSTTVTLSIQRSGSQLQLSWPSGVLQSADQVTGTYSDITPAPSSPYLVSPSLSKKFYRVRVTN
jgi:hypothetical protein